MVPSKEKLAELLQPFDGDVIKGTNTYWSTGLADETDAVSSGIVWSGLVKSALG